MPGEIGGIILTIQSIQSQLNGTGEDVESLEVRYDRVEAIHRDTVDGESRPVVLDTQDRQIEMVNAADYEILVAQFQVPVGYVEQIRIFPTEVLIHLTDGTTKTLEPGTPALPSWEQTGWKITHHEGGLFPVEEDELTGVRGLLDFDDRFVAPARSGADPIKENETADAATGWKVKPTLPAEQWQVNPLPHEPGVYADQMTLVFREGVERGRIDELNDGIGASIILNLAGSRWYRVKLPASTNFEDAFDYYDQFRDDIVAIMPGINLGLDQLIPEDIEEEPDNYEMVNFPEAWELAAEHDPRGFVGSHEVTVAFLDTGIDLDHPDLYRNIKINQENLPRALFDTDDSGEPNIDEFDCDPPADEELGLEAGNGMITFRDLACPEHADDLWIDGRPPRPADIVNDETWHEDRRDPRLDADDELGGFVNELVGWNFGDNSNNPSDDHFHGTAVASILGAEGGNFDEAGEPLGIAGGSWRVSIIPFAGPVTGDTGTPDQSDDVEPTGAVPQEYFAQALKFSQARGVDILNFSAGLTLVSEDLDFQKCGRSRGGNKVGGMSGESLDKGLDEAIVAYDNLLDEPAEMLITLSAGNDRYDVSDPEVARLPHTPMNQSDNFSGRILKVGGLTSDDARARTSNYGSDDVDLYAPGKDWRILTTPHPGHESDDVPVWQLHDGLSSCEDDRPLVCSGAAGTSFAAPLVASTASLMMAIDDSLRGDPVRVRDILIDTATEEDEVEWCNTGGFFQDPGHVLDAQAAIEEVLP